MALTLEWLREMGLARICKKRKMMHTDDAPWLEMKSLDPDCNGVGCTDCWLATCEAVVREAVNEAETALAMLIGHDPGTPHDKSACLMCVVPEKIASRFGLTTDDVNKTKETKK